MKPFSLLLSIILLASTTACQKESTEGPGQPKPIDLPAKASDVIAKSNGFGIDLFRMTATGDERNIMLSPLSASTALTMLLNGCNSQTFIQIRDMLGYEGMTIGEVNETYRSLVSQLLKVDPQVELSLANAVFYRQDFIVMPSFLASMDQSFEAEIAGLDFFAPSAVQTINKWAGDHTNGKIDHVLDAIDSEAAMFLMNALYFKGMWTYKFGDNSFSGPFYHDNGEVDSVVMMKELLPVRVYFNTEVKVAELTYGNQNFSMVVIVPESTLGEYLQGFNPATWDEITASLDAITAPQEVNMIMPRFKFEYETYLNDQLKALGMTDAFIPELADLSGISDDDLYVSFVKQNTFVEVNEEGTEAAAVTVVAVNLTSIGEPGTFIVNKPLIFAIRERTTNTLLFIGKVENPE